MIFDCSYRRRDSIVVVQINAYSIHGTGDARTYLVDLLVCE